VSRLPSIWRTMMFVHVGSRFFGRGPGGCCRGIRQHRRSLIIVLGGRWTLDALDVGRPLNSQLPFRAIFPGVEHFWGDKSESAPRCLRPRCASGTSERNSDGVCLVNSIARYVFQLLFVMAQRSTRQSMRRELSGKFKAYLEVILYRAY
jgi:hypothetical protein